jgi:hypothetical protein
MRRRRQVAASFVLALMSVAGLVPPTLAQAPDPTRPEVIGQNRVRLTGKWRVSFEHGDDDDFWFVVKTSRDPERTIHVVETLVVDIDDPNGWTVDVLVESTNDADCGNPAISCPPAFIELNQIGDWTYRLRIEDEPGGRSTIRTSFSSVSTGRDRRAPYWA